MSSDPNSEQNLDYESGTVSVVDMHDAVKREKVLHPSGKESMGTIALVLSALTLIFGGIVFGNNNGFKGTIYKHNGYQPAPRPGVAGGGVQEDNSPWIDKWMKSGKKVYLNCQACHQASGMGMPGQFPPLVGSEWVNGGTKRMGAIVLNGVGGPFKVAGQGYNGNMQPWGVLDDEKLAQVLTYVRRTFGTLSEGDDGVVTAEMMQAARAEFGGGAVWTEAGLLAIPEDAVLEGVKVDLETGEPVQ